MASAFMMCPVAARPQARALASTRSTFAAPAAFRPRPVARVAAAAPRVMAAATLEQKEEVAAVLRYVRGSPNKVRRVLDTIRGKSYEEALMILEYMPYRACEPVLKCLVSAAANAKNNNDMKKSSLYVSTCYCDEGPVMKRFQPRSRGRGFPIRKRVSHITVKVAERD